MRIIIKIPKWIENNVQMQLYSHINSLCNLLSDKEIIVLKEDDND